MMKVFQWFFTIVGLAVVLAALGIAVWELTNRGEATPPEPAAAGEPMVASEVVSAARQADERLGEYLSYGVIALAVILQLTAWSAAAVKFHSVKRSGEDSFTQLKHLDAIEVYFDLPLYFGLFGTVISFVLITLFPDAGLMFAYVSTALGIIVSVILRLLYLTPYRQQLIAGKAQGEVQL
jgi:cytosine/uracil/thiamine/allantoin permease